MGGGGGGRGRGEGIDMLGIGIAVIIIRSLTLLVHHTIVVMSANGYNTSTGSTSSYHLETVC